MLNNHMMTHTYTPVQSSWSSMTHDLSLGYVKLLSEWPLSTSVKCHLPHLWSYREWWSSFKGNRRSSLNASASVFNGWSPCWLKWSKMARFFQNEVNSGVSVQSSTVYLYSIVLEINLWKCKQTAREVPRSLLVCDCVNPPPGHFLSFFSTFLFTLGLLWHISGQEVTK